jgi:hypothetical protein
VVSKKIQEGSLYGKELKITAVLDESTFEACLEKGNIIGEIREKDLETVLPNSTQLARGERTQAMVLRGEYTGRIGKVIGIDKKRNKVDL